REQQRQKAARLRRFQGEAERESSVAMQYSGLALHLTARRDTCLFQSHPAPFICAPAAHTGLAQHQDRMQSESFQQQAAELSRSTKQARLRLASCRTIPPGLGPPELPGGVWKREPPESWEPPAEDEGKRLQPAGHHHPPAELQEQGSALPGAKPGDDFYIKIAFKKFCGGSVQASSSPKPPQRPHTHHHTPLVLWAGVDQEETKKQQQHSDSFCPHLTAQDGAGMGKLPPSISVPTGLRARRRTSAGWRSRGCWRWLSREDSPQVREPLKLWLSFSWRRGE
ncbi:CCD15 protein, partial [Tricholaema leucomelas]|nr:CCD15 protein [Tricholaema leucomelas]